MAHSDGMNYAPRGKVNHVCKPGEFRFSVIGVDHETRGEAPVAFVIGRRFHTLTTKGLREYCRERMAGYKRPRHLFFVDRVPRSASGKIDRGMAMRMFAARDEVKPG